MQDYPSPCEKCTRDSNKCKYQHCQAWLARYLYKQKQINAYAEKVLPAYYARLKGGDGGGGK